MLRSRFTIGFITALLALGCGIYRGDQARAANDAEETEGDSLIDDDAAEAAAEEDAEEDGSFVDSAVLREAGEPLTLGDAVEVPGTGVTMRPPDGAQPMPYSAGFLSVEHRVQIAVVVAVGEEEMLEQVRGNPAQRQSTGEVEEVQVAGQAGRVGRDRIQTPQGELERGWLLVHDGTRGLAIVATYEAARAPQVWPALRESLGAVEWDRDAELDPAQALGIEVDRVEGLTPSHTTTANVVLLGRGASFPPEPGQPVVSIAPLPMRLGSEQSAEICERIIARLMPVPTSDIEHEGAIENGPLPGCERLATADAEGQRMATYAALVFTESTPILVTGSVEAEQLERWRNRFSAAARAVRPRS